ncbi:FtsX-like permease family protein [bacterium]|nr:FtsX-like permease family protein [bacterium]RQV98045.1 MAG: FtsX-like permease family protein [bacterium]
MLRFALQFIKYDRPKSIGVILGIVISTFLVGQQTGIFIFLTSAMSSLVDNTDADLWVVDNRTTNCNALGNIDVRIGRQIESIPGVIKAYPLVVSGGTAKFQEGKSVPVMLIGTQPPHFKGGPFRIDQGQLVDLLTDGAVSADLFDQKELNNASLGTYFEINGKRVHIALQTKGARGFGAMYLFTTVSRARYLGNLSPNQVSGFLVDVYSENDLLLIRDRINAHIPGIRAWTSHDFSNATVSTILSTSGIAFSVGTLIIFAMISGVFIIGLTMYSAAVDRLKDYGTLKAIGANNSYIRNLILSQALFFGMTGYGMGIFLLEGFRKGISNSGILFDYSLPVKIGFFVMTMLISLGGSIFAMRRIGKLEPAMVFRA